MQSVFDRVFDIVRQDSVLEPLVGDRVRYEWAQRDEQMPYITWTLDAATREPWPIGQGTLALSVYSADTNAAEAETIARQLRVLFSHRKVTINDGSVKAVRTWWERTERLPTGDEEVWRIDIIFGIRFYEQSVATDVRERIEDEGS